MADLPCALQALRICPNYFKRKTSFVRSSKLNKFVNSPAALLLRGFCFILLSAENFAGGISAIPIFIFLRSVKFSVPPSENFAGGISATSVLLYSPLCNSFFCPLKICRQYFMSPILPLYKITPCFFHNTTLPPILLFVITNFFLLRDRKFCYPSLLKSSFPLPSFFRLIWRNRFFFPIKISAFISRPLRCSTLAFVPPKDKSEYMYIWSTANTIRLQADRAMRSSGQLR